MVQNYWLNLSNIDFLSFLPPFRHDLFILNEKSVVLCYCRVILLGEEEEWLRSECGFLPWKTTLEGNNQINHLNLSVQFVRQWIGSNKKEWAAGPTGYWLLGFQDEDVILSRDDGDGW